VEKKKKKKAESQRNSQVVPENPAIVQGFCPLLPSVRSGGT